MKVGIALYAVTVPFLFGIIVANLTFTLVCYAILAVSIMCLIHGFFISDKRASVMLYVFSAVLGVLSVLLRAETVATTVVYVGSLTLLMLLKYKKRALHFVLTVVVMFGAIGLFSAADRAYYNSSTELKEYIRFNTIRSHIQDGAPLDPVRYQEVFENHGWSIHDIEMVRDFYLPDAERFDTEVMESLYDAMALTRYNKDAYTISVDFRNVFYSGNVYVLICLLAFFGAAITTQRSGLFKAYAILLAALPFLFNIFFSILWRAVFRVTFPHYVLSAMVLLMFIDAGSIMPEGVIAAAKRAVNMVFACLLAAAAVGAANLLLQVKWNNIERASSYGSALSAIPESYEYISQNKDIAFVYPTTNLMRIGNDCYSIFHAFPKDFFINSRMLGGWDARSPSYNDFKERYGLNILPEDLLNNSDVFLVLIAPENDTIADYFKENYGIGVEYRNVIQLGEGITAVNVWYEGGDAPF